MISFMIWAVQRPAEVEALHHLREPLPFLAQQVILRDAGVLEVQQPAPDRHRAHVVEALTYHPWCVQWYQKCADALCTYLLGARPGEDHRRARLGAE
jgi:hypothetical protein